MYSALRVLAWLAIVLAVGVQASGLGSLGYSLCVERSGSLCGIEAPGQHCCSEESTNLKMDGGSVVTCDHCVNSSLSLPSSTAAPVPLTFDQVVMEAVHPMNLPWLFQQQHEVSVRVVRSDRSRAPPLASSLRIARTIVLRV